MHNLIKIKTSENNTQIVSCKELYLELGLDKSNWKRWYTKNILKNGFIEKDIDYTSLVIKTNGNETMDFAVTIDLAKRICMMARTEKGEMVRRYFIRVEEKYKKLKSELNKKEIARLAGIEARKQLTDTIKELIPDSPHKCFVYPNYTNLIYKILFNKNAKQFREEFRITKKENLREYFASEDLEKIKSLESIVQGYVQLGMGYKEIKELLEQYKTKMIGD